MKKKLMLIISSGCMVISIVLMLLPTSARLLFASPTERLIKTYSYIDMMVWGYGNFFPILTFALSLIVLIVILWTLLSRKYGRIREMALKTCSVICLATSALSLLLFSSISNEAIMICILLFMSTLLLFIFFYLKKKSVINSK